jgi:hypothetical protein
MMVPSLELELTRAFRFFLIGPSPAVTATHPQYRNQPTQWVRFIRKHHFCHLEAPWSLNGVTHEERCSIVQVPVRVHDACFTSGACLFPPTH